MTPVARVLIASYPIIYSRRQSEKRGNLSDGTN